jgi:predicted esterase
MKSTRKSNGIASWTPCTRARRHYDGRRPRRTRFALLIEAVTAPVCGLLIGCGGGSGGHTATAERGDAAIGLDSNFAGQDGMPGSDTPTPSLDAALDTSFPFADTGPSSTRQAAKPLGGTNTAPNGYYEYLPPGYDGSKAAPLLVFWHGISADGNGTTDLNKVLAYGPPVLIANDKWDAARPFIVLSPQYTAKSGNIGAGEGCPSSAVVDAFLKWAIANYNVDPKRVYLTGLSCGAIGSWDYLGNFQGAMVAAAVLLAGDPGDPTQSGSVWNRAGCNLGTAAIWSLHGDADTVVPFAPEQATLQDLIACPAPPRREAKFTDLVGAGHSGWDAIYDLSGGHGDIYQWMLANAKP